MARLLEKYRAQIAPELQKDLGYANPMAVPRLEKIVVSMGVGKAVENRARLEHAQRELAQITGQKPLVTRAHVSVAAFHLRQGQEIGLKATIRGRRMYEFLDRLISVVIPRIRDFRGLSTRAFDKAGNYSMGVSEQGVFPEVPLDKIEFTQGMNITLCISAQKPSDSFEMLKKMGVPFRTET